MSTTTEPCGGGCDRDCGAASPTGCIERHPGRYLVAVLRLTADSDCRASTTEVSAIVGVESPSATEMLGKLDDRGLAEREDYHGTTLTERGETVARELLWRQRTVRAFFVSRLNLLLERGRAYRIGYLLPVAGVERLSRLAGAESVGELK